MKRAMGGLLTQAGQVARATRIGRTRADIDATLGAAASHGRTAGNEPSARPVARAPARPAAGDEAWLAGTHVGAAGRRDYRLYVPPRHVGRALPLLVMLHGGSQDPDDFAAGTAMNDVARDAGCYVLYPAQPTRANLGRCWNWFDAAHQGRGGGEPALIVGIVDDVMAAHRIDRRRVYIAGLSAGGAMAAILGGAYPDRFAAIGVHSGLPVGAASDLSGALAAMRSGAAGVEPPAAAAPPTIVFHGDDDATVHPANGHGVLAGQARTAPACTESGHDNGRDYTRALYRDARGAVVAEHWTVHGAGHAWSGGRTAGSYADAAGPDASAEMVRFFLAQRLPSAN